MNRSDLHPSGRAPAINPSAAPIAGGKDGRVAAQVGGKPPPVRVAGAPEVVARFDGPMPTGVTVSADGRIFVCFPRWEDAVEATVVEIVGGRAVPYPDAAINRLDLERAAATFVSVQSVVVDPAELLWILDTGSLNFGPAIHAPKLVAVDLATNRVVQTIRFPAEVVPPASSPNDIRFDLRRGAGGYAFVTDASALGRNGIIVVDLATGASRRRLDDHPSTKAVPSFVPTVEGRPLLEQPKGFQPRPIRIGADGIAIGADGARLFYSPLASRRLYSVSVDALVDRALPDAEVGRTVRDEGEKGASDGLESDAQGRLYVTDYERNAVRRLTNGMPETLYEDGGAALWPDTLAVAGDGYLYLIANQLQRLRRFNNGEDRRTRPFALFRLPNDGTPVHLR